MSRSFSLRVVETLPSPKLTTTVGFPFLGITWKPTTWFTFQFRGIPGIFQTGGLEFHLREKVDLFLRYRGANFRFFVDADPNDHRRLFYTEQRVELGVRVKPAEGWGITLVAGWAFEREFGTGWDVRSNDTLVGIDGAVLFGLTITFRF